MIAANIYYSPNAVVSAMLEASGENAPHDVFRTCLEQAVLETERIVDLIADLQQSVGKCKRTLPEVAATNADVTYRIDELARDSITKTYSDFTHHKVRHAMTL